MSEYNKFTECNFGTTREFTVQARDLNVTTLKELNKRQLCLIKDGRRPTLKLSSQEIELKFSNPKDLREFREALSPQNTTTPLCSVQYLASNEENSHELDIAISFSALDSTVLDDVNFIFDEDVIDWGDGTPQSFKSWKNQVVGKTPHSENEEIKFLIVLNPDVLSGNTSAKPEDDIEIKLLHSITKIDIVSTLRFIPGNTGAALKVFSVKREKLPKQKNARAIHIVGNLRSCKNETQSKHSDLSAFEYPQISFIKNWINYEQKCEELDLASRGEKARNPLHALQLLRKDGDNFCYITQSDTNSSKAWANIKSGEEVHVTKVIDPEFEDISNSKVAVVTLFNSDEIRLSFTDNKPLDPSFWIYPGADKGDLIQRERRKDALLKLNSGETGIQNLLKSIQNPETLTPNKQKEFAPIVQTTSQYNAKQRESIGRSLGISGLLLIQGPPGTGKTTVIAEIVGQKIDGSGAITTSTPKILLSAQGKEAIRHVRQTLETKANITVYHHPSRRLSDEELQGIQNNIRKNVVKKTLEIDSAMASRKIYQRLLDLEKFSGELQHFYSQLLSSNHELNSQDFSSLLNIIVTKRSEWGIPLDSTKAVVKLLENYISNKVEQSTNKTNNNFSTIQEFEETKLPAAEKLQTLARSLDEHKFFQVSDLVQSTLLALDKFGKDSDVTTNEWNKTKKAIESCKLELPSNSKTTEQSFDEFTTELQKLSNLIALSIETTMSRDGIASAIYYWCKGLADNPSEWGEMSKRYARATTCTCQLASDQDLTTGEQFDLVIIDEAAQVGLDILIPLILAPQVILVGDHKQLPPYVDSIIGKQIEKNLSDQTKYTSLFEHLWHNAPDECRITLNIQYRMHEGIGEIVSKCFYKQTPLDHYFKNDKNKHRAPTLDFGNNKPFVWVDTSDILKNAELRKEYNVPSTQFMEYNDWEAKLFETLMLKALANGKLKGNTFGVVCMYKKQLNKINSLLESAAFDAISPYCEAGTCDSFQGKEFDYVFVFTSRESRPTNHLLRPNRINVAISRAKKQVLFFADLRYSAFDGAYKDIRKAIESDENNFSSILESRELL